MTVTITPDVAELRDFSLSRLERRLQPMAEIRSLQQPTTQVAHWGQYSLLLSDVAAAPVKPIDKSKNRDTEVEFGAYSFSSHFSSLGEPDLIRWMDDWITKSIASAVNGDHVDRHKQAMLRAASLVQEWTVPADKSDDDDFLPPTRDCVEKAYEIVLGMIPNSGDSRQLDQCKLLTFRGISRSSEGEIIIEFLVPGGSMTLRVQPDGSVEQSLYKSSRLMSTSVIPS